mgnify:CR=1 FL=1
MTNDIWPTASLRGCAARAGLGVGLLVLLFKVRAGPNGQKIRDRIGQVVT